MKCCYVVSFVVLHCWCFIGNCCNAIWKLQMVWNIEVSDVLIFTLRLQLSLPFICLFIFQFLAAPFTLLKRKYQKERQNMIIYGWIKSKTKQLIINLLLYSLLYQGIARTQSPTNKNYALELPTFGVIVGVSPTEVQWKCFTLALEKPPSW